MNNVEKAMLLRDLIAQYQRESIGERGPVTIRSDNGQSVSGPLVVGNGRLPELARQISDLKRDLGVL